MPLQYGTIQSRRCNISRDVSAVRPSCALVMSRWLRKRQNWSSAIARMSSRVTPSPRNGGDGWGEGRAISDDMPALDSMRCSIFPTLSSEAGEGINVSPIQRAAPRFGQLIQPDLQHTLFPARDRQLAEMLNEAEIGHLCDSVECIAHRLLLFDVAQFDQI